MLCLFEYFLLGCESNKASHHTSVINVDDSLCKVEFKKPNDLMNVDSIHSIDGGVNVWKMSFLGRDSTKIFVRIVEGRPFYDNMALRDQAAKSLIGVIKKDSFVMIKKYTSGEYVYTEFGLLNANVRNCSIETMRGKTYVGIYMVDFKGSEAFRYYTNNLADNLVWLCP